MPELAKTEGSVPVDLFNPGQVFACLGFAEAADVLCGDVEAYFDWCNPTDARFRLRADGEQSPIARVLHFLAGASARAEAVEGSPNIEKWKASWGPAPVTAPRLGGYPFPDPGSPATLVCVISSGDERLLLDHWGDASGRDNVKFWTGSSGRPGAALAQDALNQLEHLDPDSNDPLSFSAPQSSSFRLDWRRDYVPIDAGFSPNAHSKITPLGFPVVELLGALGLTAARPRRTDRRDKLRYEYAVAGRSAANDAHWLPLTFLRAALGGAVLPFPTRRFHMRLSWPGKEGQARSITTVTEENRT